MSHPWEGELSDYEDHFLEAQQLSQRLATVVEEPDAGLFMPGEDEDPFRPARLSTTASFPPRSSSIPTAAERTQPFASQRTTPAESTMPYPTMGRTESPFEPFRASSSTSAPPRPSNNPATLESTSADSTGRYPTPERPATPTQRTTLDSRPETQSHITEEERACCLACAKVSDKCFRPQSQIKERCLRCRNMNIACVPIPSEHLPGYLAAKQLFREGGKMDGYDALWAWAKSTEATSPLIRIERQLFLLNRNVERLLQVQLRMNGEPAPRSIEEEFPMK